MTALEISKPLLEEPFPRENNNFEDATYLQTLGVRQSDESDKYAHGISSVRKGKKSLTAWYFDEHGKQKNLEYKHPRSHDEKGTPCGFRAD